MLVTPAARARAEAALKRFEESIQALLDAPLNADLVGEWTAFRALNA
ncbi:MAG TPA: hypothetical protein VHN37_07355 [Actinomycetota bacterium]|nr:hypothetical protein [Actinomycetota bacterium]